MEIVQRIIGWDDENSCGFSHFKHTFPFPFFDIHWLFFYRCVWFVHRDAEMKEKLKTLNRIEQSYLTSLHRCMRQSSISVLVLVTILALEVLLLFVREQRDNSIYEQFVSASEALMEYWKMQKRNNSTRNEKFIDFITNWAKIDQMKSINDPKENAIQTNGWNGVRHCRMDKTSFF